MISTTMMAGSRRHAQMRVGGKSQSGLGTSSGRSAVAALRQRQGRRSAHPVVVRAQTEEEFDLVEKVQKLLDGDTKEKVMKHVGMIAKLFDGEDGAGTADSNGTEAPEVVTVKLPEGVSTPSQVPKIPTLTFGFTSRAERWNSRAAMIGFFSLLFVELIFGKGLLELMGFEVGNGLGFEF